MLIGLDEVGRGCWAGPLLAAAVVLPAEYDIPGLNDSKKLTAAKRQVIDILIRQQAVAIGVGWVWPQAIDISGITAAVKDAMRQAYDECLVKLQQAVGTGLNVPHETIGSAHDVVVDGNYNYLPGVAGVRMVIGADGSIPAVSAASIIAKVARDNYMAQVAAIAYPEYGFERHVGYGTALHIAALQRYGVTDIHRTSYKPIRNLSEAGPKSAN